MDRFGRRTINISTRWTDLDAEEWSTNYFPWRFYSINGWGQASTDEDGRLRTFYPSIRSCWQWTEIWAQTVHLIDKFGRWSPMIGPRLSFEGGRVDRFLPWTVHLMDEFRRWTKKIILRWTIWRIFESMDGFGRKMINISTKWMEVDEWTGGRMKQTGRWTGDPLTIFRGDYIQLTVEV